MQWQSNRLDRKQEIRTNCRSDFTWRRQLHSSVLSTKKYLSLHPIPFQVTRQRKIMKYFNDETAFDVHIHITFWKNQRGACQLLVHKVEDVDEGGKEKREKNVTEF